MKYLILLLIPMQAYAINQREFDYMQQHPGVFLNQIPREAPPAVIYQAPVKVQDQTPVRHNGQAPRQATCYQNLDCGLGFVCYHAGQMQNQGVCIEAPNE